MPEVTSEHLPHSKLKIPTEKNRIKKELSFTFRTCANKSRFHKRKIFRIFTYFFLFVFLKGEGNRRSFAAAAAVWRHRDGGACGKGAIFLFQGSFRQSPLTALPYELSPLCEKDQLSTLTLVSPFLPFLFRSFWKAYFWHGSAFYRRNGTTYLMLFIIRLLICYS